VAETSRRDNTPKRIQTLADQLAAVLQKAGPSHGGPLVIENRIPQTKSLHTTVIWDKWNDLQPSDRSKVIIDAYAQANCHAGWTITVAMGLTSAEALRLGFLPYSIVTTCSKGDPESSASLVQAMSGAGGVVLKIGATTQLRFPTLGEAKEAYRQLAQRIPGPYWAIIHEQPNTE